MGTDRFLVSIKIVDIYKGIGKHVEMRSDNSNYELRRPLPKV